MAVGATFEDSPGTDFLGQQMSLMQRAQSMRIQKAQEDRQQAQYVAMQPVLAATRQAEIAGAQASIANATRMEELKTRAAAESPIANNEFLDAVSLAGFDEKANKLAELQSKYSWMGLIPEYKGFIDTINDERVKSHQAAVTNYRLDEQLELEKQRAADRLEQNAQMGDLKKAIAGMQIAGQNDRNAATNDTKLELAATSAQGRLEQAKLKAERQYELDSAIEKRDEALRSGNRERAQIYQDHINKMTSFAAAPKSNPLPASAPAASVAPISEAKEIKLPSGATVRVREKK